jgi:hypothetical protein
VAWQGARLCASEAKGLARRGRERMQTLDNQGHDVVLAAIELRRGQRLAPSAGFGWGAHARVPGYPGPRMAVLFSAGTSIPGPAATTRWRGATVVRRQALAHERHNGQARKKRGRGPMAC